MNKRHDLDALSPSSDEGRPSPRRQFLRLAWGGAVGVGAAALATGASAQPLSEQGWRERYLTGFGTTLSVRLWHARPAVAEQALEAAVGLIRRIEDQMSLFRDDSAVRQLNRQGVLHRPAPELLAVLRLAQSVSAQSQGRFDVTVQPLWEVFARAKAGSAGLPSPRQVAQAKARVGWQHLRLSQEAVWFERPGMGVTLNGIAQGFAADAVKACLQGQGIEHALIDTGEFQSLGQAEAARPWVLGVADPHDEARLLTRLVSDGRAVATSGDNATYFSADHRHHHIFDPRTGYSPTELSGVTVVAPQCGLADALTKVMMVAGRDQALQLAASWGPQIDVLVVDKAGRWQATPGLQLRSP